MGPPTRIPIVLGYLRSMGGDGCGNRPRHRVLMKYKTAVFYFVGFVPVEPWNHGSSGICCPSSGAPYRRWWCVIVCDGAPFASSPSRRIAGGRKTSNTWCDVLL